MKTPERITVEIKEMLHFFVPKRIFVVRLEETDEEVETLDHGTLLLTMF